MFINIQNKFKNIVIFVDRNSKNIHKWNNYKFEIYNLLNLSGLYFPKIPKSNFHITLYKNNCFQISNLKSK